MIFYLGLDIGQSQDYTALAVVRRHDPNGETEADRLAIRLRRRRAGQAEAEPAPIEYHVLALDRLELGMPYPKQVAIVRQRLTQLAGETVELAIDRTGVGAAVYDMFAALGVETTGISITGGNQVASVPGGYSVPKRDIVTAALVSLETDQLKIAQRLKLWPAAREEMKAFERTVSASGHDSYNNNARESEHDDLVLALSMACWLARHREEDSGYWRMV